VRIERGLIDGRTWGIGQVEAAGTNLGAEEYGAKLFLGVWKSTAAIKSFTGEPEAPVCTSTSAAVMNWALRRRKVFVFSRDEPWAQTPDTGWGYAGRNDCWESIPGKLGGN